MVVQLRHPADSGVAFEDAFPLNPGHMLVVPRIHDPALFALPGEGLGE